MFTILLSTILTICSSIMFRRIFNRKENHNALLIKNGRKTMATITQIEYVGTKNNNESENILTNLNDEVYIDDNFSNGYHYYQTKGREIPIFKLTYTFNPPDDSLDEDLVHSIYVPFDPGQTLKPGDILPILYYIDPNNNGRVASTPFPYPVDKIYHIDDIYCRTNNNTKY